MAAHPANGAAHPANGAANPADGDASESSKDRKAPPDGEPAAAPNASEADAAQAPKPAKKRKWPIVLAIVVALVVIAAIAVTAAFAWNRWYRYDDAADIQGKWYPVGSTEAISIGPDAITFNDDVSYEYTLDAGEKTLSYRLGPLEGKGHYWFSDDRESLVIWDGDAFTPTDTAFDDLARTLSEVGASLEGAEMALPEGEGVSAFTRQADPELVARKAEAERQAREAEEAKARAEQEAAEAEARAAEEAQSEEAQEFANESMGIIE